MPTYLIISRHSPENCAMFNEKARRALLDFMGKVDELQKKRGFKLLGGWGVPSEHLSFMVIEAPSMEAFQEVVMEPEIAAMSAYSTTEIKMVISLEETMQMLQQTK